MTQQTEQSTDASITPELVAELIEFVRSFANIGFFIPEANAMDEDIVFTSVGRVRRARDLIARVEAAA